MTVNLEKWTGKVGHEGPAQQSWKQSSSVSSCWWLELGAVHLSVHLGMEAQEFKASMECIRDSLSHIKIKIIIKQARKVGEVSEGHVKIGRRQPRDLSRTQDKISDAQRRLGQDRVLCVALKRVVIAIKHYFKIHHGNKSNKKCMPL